MKKIVFLILCLFPFISVNAEEEFSCLTTTQDNPFKIESVNFSCSNVTGSTLTFFQNETDLDTYIQERQLLQLQVDTKELEKQLQFLRREEEILSQKDRIEEFMFLGLRMMKGICVEEFSQRFGQEIEEVYGEIIAKYERQKLLEKYEKMGKHYIALTEEGIQISNRIFVDFML